MASDPKIAVAIGAEDRELVQALAGVTEAIKRFAAHTQQQMKEVQKSLSFSTAATAFKPVVEMLSQLKARIMDTADAAVAWSRQVNAMARTIRWRFARISNDFWHRARHRAPKSGMRSP